MLRSKEGIFLLLILSWLLHAGCGSAIRKANLHRIKGIELLYNLPVFNTETREILNFSDTMHLYYYEDLVLYRFTDPYDITKFFYDSVGNIIGDSLISSGITHSYFIYKENNREGVFYWSIDSLK